MPRIPYVFPAPGESTVADEIRERRKDGKLIDLDGTLLNAPKIAEGYSRLLRAVRTENSLPDDVRELMILRVAALNSAAYEWIAHEPVGRRAGLTQAALAAIRDVAPAPAAPGPLSPLHAAALAYTDHMTKSVRVPQAAFDALRALLRDDQQMLEATATIAAYNMVSRILVALDVSDKAETGVPQIGVEGSGF